MIEQVGFVKLRRALVDWEWYTDVNTCKLFFHCLIKANYSDKKWRGITIRRGEFITSIDKLAVETGLTASKVRTALQKLELTSDLKVVTTSKYSKVIVMSQYFDSKDFYSNQKSKRVDKRLSNQPQTNRNPVATTKKEQEEAITKRIMKFRENVFAHSNFNNEILESFFNYWSELNISKEEMRFETEGFFEIDKRLKKWFDNERPKKGGNNAKSKALFNR